MDVFEYVKPLLTGLLVGIIFAALKLPIPAPSAFAGIVGIFGIYLGFVLWQKFF
jgi:XapX domain-containing protein